MARGRKKKALYEVIAEGRFKSPDKPLGRVPSEGRDRDEPAAPETTGRLAEAVTRWPKRPRTLQFNTGRIELSVPYPIAITFVLGVVLVVLIAFRLGQITYLSEQETTGGPAPGTQEIDKNRPEGSRAETTDAAIISTDLPASAEHREAGEPKGDNVIVLVEFQARADLVPVRDHFARHGIETEITRENERYFLITKDRYDNPKRPGTDGYEARQRIIEVGAKYKAPPGYETFAPHFFSDAYGRKVK